MTMSEAITSGTWEGMTLGVYEVTEQLSDAALEYLRRPDLKPLSPKEEGVAAALVKLGFLRRTFWTKRLVATGKAIGRPSAR